MTFWTVAHAKTMLPIIALGLVLAIVLRLLIGRAKLWVRMIPLQLLSLLLVAMEIQKQISGQKTGYHLLYLPFHFCSLFLIVLPLASFYFGKGSESIRSLAFTFTATVSILTLIAPGSIVSTAHIESASENYISLHSILFHCIIPIAFFLMLSLDLARPRLRRDILITIVIVAIYCVVAAEMATRLLTNYSNFYYCNIDFIEEYRLSLLDQLGEIETRKIYIPCVALAHLLANLLGLLAATGLSKLTCIRDRKLTEETIAESIEAEPQSAESAENTVSDDQKSTDV